MTEIRAETVRWDEGNGRGKINEMNPSFYGKKKANRPLERATRKREKTDHQCQGGDGDVTVDPTAT